MFARRGLSDCSGRLCRYINKTELKRFFILKCIDLKKKTKKKTTPHSRRQQIVSFQVYYLGSTMSIYTAIQDITKIL